MLRLAFLLRGRQSTTWLVMYQLQVLVSVKAAGVNPVDTYKRAGTYPALPPLPYTPGSDLSGVVEKVGAKVSKYKVCVTIRTHY